jgi:hypothetical protein
MFGAAERPSKFSCKNFAILDLDIVTDVSLLMHLLPAVVHIVRRVMSGRLC